jgi:exonuclease III
VPRVSREVNRLQEFAVWDALELAGGWTTMAQLARRTALAPGVLRRTLDRMLERGWIDRTEPMMLNGPHGGWTYWFRRHVCRERRRGAR